MPHPLKNRIEQLKKRVADRSKRTAQYAQQYDKYNGYIRANRDLNGKQRSSWQWLGIPFNRVADGFNVILSEGPAIGKGTLAAFHRRTFQNFGHTNTYRVLSLGHIDRDFNNFFNFENEGIIILDNTGARREAKTELKEEVKIENSSGQKQSDYKITNYTLTTKGSQDTHSKPLLKDTNIEVDRNIGKGDIVYGPIMVDVLFSLMNETLENPNKALTIHCLHGIDRTGSSWMGMKSAFSVLYPTWAAHHFPEIQNPIYQQDDNLHGMLQALDDARRFDRPSIMLNMTHWLNVTHIYSDELIKREIDRNTEKLKKYESKDNQVVVVDEKELDQIITVNKSKNCPEKLDILAKKLSGVFTSDATMDPAVWLKFKNYIATTVEAALEEKTSTPEILGTIHQIVQLSELVAHELTENPNEIALVNSKGNRILQDVSARILECKYAERNQQIQQAIESLSKLVAVTSDSTQQREFLANSLVNTLYDSLYNLIYVLDRAKVRLQTINGQSDHKSEIEYLTQKIKTIVNKEREIVPQLIMCFNKFNSHFSYENHKYLKELEATFAQVELNYLSSDELAKRIATLFQEFDKAFNEKNEDQLADIYKKLSFAVTNAKQREAHTELAVYMKLYEIYGEYEEAASEIIKSYNATESLKEAKVAPDTQLSITILIGGSLSPYLMAIKEGIQHAKQVNDEPALKYLKKILNVIEKNLEQLLEFVKRTNYVGDVRNCINYRIYLAQLGKGISQNGRPVDKVTIKDCIEIHLEDIRNFKKAEKLEEEQAKASTNNPSQPESKDAGPQLETSAKQSTQLPTQQPATTEVKTSGSEKLLADETRLFPSAGSPRSVRQTVQAQQSALPAANANSQQQGIPATDNPTLQGNQVNMNDSLVKTTTMRPPG